MGFLKGVYLGQSLNKHPLENVTLMVMTVSWIYLLPDKYQQSETQTFFSLIQKKRGHHLFLNSSRIDDLIASLLWTAYLWPVWLYDWTALLPLSSPLARLPLSPSFTQSSISHQQEPPPIVSLVLSHAKRDGTAILIVPEAC